MQRGEAKSTVQLTPDKRSGNRERVFPVVLSSTELTTILQRPFGLEVRTVNLCSQQQVCMLFIQRGQLFARQYHRECPSHLHPSCSVSMWHATVYFSNKHHSTVYKTDSQFPSSEPQFPISSRTRPAAPEGSPTSGGIVPGRRSVGRRRSTWDVAAGSSLSSRSSGRRAASSGRSAPGPQWACGGRRETAPVPPPRRRPVTSLRHVPRRR